MDSKQNLSVEYDFENGREKFIKELNGTSMGDVILYSSQFPLLAFVAVWFELWILRKINMTRSKFAPKNIMHALFVLFLEVFAIVLPVTVMFTVLSNYIYIFFILVIGFITLIVISSVSCVDDHVLYWKFTKFEEILSSKSMISEKQLFITYFRSFVLLVTAVSILGVDFHIFPRRFAKTESYGVSLMDLGVGLFIVSNALVEKRSSSVSQLKKTLSSSVILLVLGVLRYLLVQQFDYQIHVTEYGIHWNFFFTLAFVRLLSCLVLIVFREHSFLTGIVFVLIHQYILNYSLEPLVLSNQERDSWFNANREGIISLSGYLSINLIANTISNFVKPIDKHYPTKQKLQAIVMFSLMSVFLLCILFYFDSVGFKVSRRLANLPYVIWIVTVSLQLLVLFLFVELLSLWFLPIDPSCRNNLYHYLIPVLLESINLNGLFFFLISNCLTGLVNMYVDAFTSGPIMSVLILLSYMFVTCGIVFFLFVYNIRLKF